MWYSVCETEQHPAGKQCRERDDSVCAPQGPRWYEREFGHPGAMRRGVGPQGSVAFGAMLLEMVPALATTLVDHLGGRRLRGGTLVLLREIQGRGQSHRGISGTGPLLGQVSPWPGAELGKNEEGGDLLQAWSLPQKIMTPEDFAKYQGMVAPRPKQKKTREQEVADRVKNLKKLRGQEASHKGQVDKLELDLQLHRDMLREVLSRISTVWR